MTADDKREQLEALLWREVGEPGLVGRILAASAAVEKAAAREAVAAAREPKAEAPAQKAPAVHYAPAGTGGPACLGPHERVRSSWRVTAGPVYVTCGHCQKTPAWQEASAPRPALAPVANLKPPVPPDDRMAVTPDGDIRPVSEFKPGEKWWCDGEDCGEDLGYPHVHPGWGLPAALAVDLQTGWDERHPEYVKRDGGPKRSEVPG